MISAKKYSRRNTDCEHLKSRERLWSVISALLFIIIYCSVLSGCSVIPGQLSDADKFKIQACSVVYCESTERSKIKRAGLKMMSISASAYGLNLDLERGVCEEYYSKRELFEGYVYARRSAYDICMGDD